MSNSYFIALTLGMAAVTFLIRFSFIGLAGKIQMSERVTKTLRFVPVTVLPAIITIQILSVNSSMEFEQARQSLENVKAIVEAAGLSVGQIVKTTVFVKDLADFAAINAAYEAFFTEHQAAFPARSCVEVARLPKDAGVEIEAIAFAR